MILTSDYLPVLASFDYPLNFKKDVGMSQGYENKGDGSMIYKFDVGPLTYRLEMNGVDGTWGVAFSLEGIKGSNEELARFFSRVFRRTVKPSLVPDVKRDLLNRSMGVLGLGNASQVFSNVFGIIKDVVDNYIVNCIVFMTTDKKRSSVYRLMVKKYLKGWDLTDDSGTFFKVCRE